MTSTTGSITERSQRNVQRAAMVTGQQQQLNHHHQEQHQSKNVSIVPQTLKVQGQTCQDAKGQTGIYTGEILVQQGGIPHGSGEMKYSFSTTHQDSASKAAAPGSASSSVTVSYYQGDWWYGEWQGEGLCRLDNGDVYVGSFVGHERHGKGEYTWASTKTTTTTSTTLSSRSGTDDDKNNNNVIVVVKQRAYRGDFWHNQRHGHGTYIWRTLDASTGELLSKPSTYTGSFVNGQRQGQGVFISPSRLKYTGEWYQGQYHGYGVLEDFIQGTLYRGYLEASKKHGRGTLIQERPPQRRCSSSKETGEEDESEIESASFQKSTVIHEGLWVDDEPCVEPDLQPPPANMAATTPGTTIAAVANQPLQNPMESREGGDDNSSVASFTVFSTPQLVRDALGLEGYYKGIVQRGLPQGVGTMNYLEGYELQQEGQGVLEYEGFWQAGHKHGFGRATYINGHTYQGNWVYNQAQGPGEYTYYPPSSRGSTTTNNTATAGSSMGGGPAPIPDQDLSQARLYKGVFHQSLLHNGSNVDGMETRSVCQVLYANGDVYEGDYWEGNKQGHGTMTFDHDGSRYEGDFQAGVYHGEGRLATPLAVYTGAFARGVFHGPGKLQAVGLGMQAPHTLYEGRWSQGFPDPQDDHEKASLHKSLTRGHLYIPHPPLDDPWVPPSKDIEFASAQQVSQNQHMQYQPLTHDALVEILDQQAIDNQQKHSGGGGDGTVSSLVRRLSPLPNLRNKLTVFVPKGTIPPPQVTGGNSSSTVNTTSKLVVRSNYATAPVPAPAPAPSIATSLTSSLLSTFMSSSSTGNSSHPSPGKKAEPRKPPACKAVVDVAVWDGQENPGRYTGLLHLESQRPHGVGRMVYQDGNRIHEGFWEYGHRQGHGRCLFVKIGDYHEGNYHQNLREGPGKYFWKDGRQFVGNYHQDERSGQGKFLYPNGDSYVGNFEKGLRHGQGTFIFGNRKRKGGSSKQQQAPSSIETTRYQGAWKNGVYDGMGRLEWKTSMIPGQPSQLHVYEGLFEGGVFQGAGIETIDEVVVRQGIWDAGRFIASTGPEKPGGLIEPTNSLDEQEMVDSFEKVQIQDVEDAIEGEQPEKKLAGNYEEVLKKAPSMDLEDDLVAEEVDEEHAHDSKQISRSLAEPVQPARERASHDKATKPLRNVSSAECASTMSEQVNNYELQRLQWRQSLEPAV